MKKEIAHLSIIISLLFLFTIGISFPRCTRAQTLPPWGFSPWGNNFGLGYPRGYGIDVFSYYNIAASINPLQTVSYI